MKKVLIGIAVTATVGISYLGLTNTNNNPNNIPSITPPQSITQPAERPLEKGYISSSDMLLYLTDIEQQTHRTIPDNQRKLLMAYIKNNKVEKLSPDITKIHRDDFDKNKKKIISNWEYNTNQKFPKYNENILSDKGKIARKIGNNYDLHHIIELSYGGVNEWYNMHPAKFPSEHQIAIHRKNGIADKLFGDSGDE